MFVADQNFMAGKGFHFKKGDEVFGDSETIKRLISEGLVKEIKNISGENAEASVVSSEASVSSETEKHPHSHAHSHKKEEEHHKKKKVKG